MQIFSNTVRFWPGWSSLVELICSLTVRIFSPPFVPSSASHSGLDVLITLTEWKIIPAAISDFTAAAQRKAWHDLHAAWMLCACQSLTGPDIWRGCEWHLLYFQSIEWLVLHFVWLTECDGYDGSSDCIKRAMQWGSCLINSSRCSCRNSFEVSEILSGKQRLSLCDLHTLSLSRSASLGERLVTELKTEKGRKQGVVWTLNFSKASWLFLMSLSF